MNKLQQTHLTPKQNSLSVKEAACRIIKQLLNWSQTYDTCASRTMILEKYLCKY